MRRSGFPRLGAHPTETYSDFRTVPANLTFAQGVELLKKQQATLAENQRTEADRK